MSFSSFDSSTVPGLVSIIIPAYNAELWIERSIKSALQQTYSKVEVIVVENGSSDKTIEKIKTIQDPRVQLLYSEKGVSHARNKGIEQARGEFLTFLDADDWLAKDAIQRLMALVDGDVDLISARYYGDKPFETYTYKRYENAEIDKYIEKCLYTPTKRGNATGNIYRTDFIRTNDISFHPDLTHAEDSVFFISLLLKHPIVIDCEEPVYYVYANPESATRKQDNDYSEDFRKSIIEVYGLLKERGQEIKNSGYIFALNQLLVLLVHKIYDISFTEGIREIKRVSEIDVYKEAIINSDISHVSILPRLVFFTLKKKFYLCAYAAMYSRARNNHKIQNT